MRRRIVVFLYFMVLTGCASMKHNYVPEATKADWPEINKETSVFVGDKMLVQGYKVDAKALSINSTVDGACYDIPHGKYPMVGEDSDNLYFSASGTNGVVVRAALCDPYTGMRVPSDNLKMVCIITVFGASACYEANQSIEEIESVRASNKQSNLLYSGKEGDQIKFTYIESQGGHPPFSHNVSYNIKESNIIAYRGARIKIHNSSNEQVTYTVLQTFTERQ